MGISRKNILIFVAVLIALGVLIFFVFNKEKQKQAELPPVFSIIGEITKITENGFQVKTLKTQNGLGEDKDFLVLMASSTIFSGIEIPQTISQEDATKPILAQKANLSDLKVKDIVVVESNDNLRGVSQFTAKSAQILEYAK
ncbi:MAG: hypothetical protein Q7R99_03025 [bacterium]|nr:hypothetical protein [bacterium]